MNRKRRQNALGRAERGTRNGARAAILEAVRRARPRAAPLPLVAGVQDTAGGAELVARFMASAQAASATVRRVEAGGVEAAVREAFPAGASIASANPAWAFEEANPADEASAPWSFGFESGHPPFEQANPADEASALARLDVLVCPGAFGVAENGAVWLAESGMGSRAAPFLAQHLVLALDHSAIVPDMHAACDRLETFGEGYGAFVAGPSKTADIEQTLVIGAHGPRSLTVLLT